MSFRTYLVGALNGSICQCWIWAYARLFYIYMGSVKRSFMNDSKSKCKEDSSHARLWCGSNSHERETGLWNAICHSSSAVGRKWANFPSFISPDLSMSNDNVLHKGRALLKDERWQVGGGQGCLSWAASALTLQQPVSSDSQCHTSRLSHQKDKNHLGNTNVQPMQHQQHRQRQTISHQQIPPTGRVKKKTFLSLSSPALKLEKRFLKILIADDQPGGSRRE